MRLFAVLLCALPILLAVGFVHAYYNDSDVIELTDVDPPEPEESSSEEGETGDGGSTNEGGSDDSGGSSEGSSSDDSGGSSSSGGSSGGGSGGSSESSSEEDSDSGGSDDVDDVVAELVGAGAIEGLSSVSGSSGAGSPGSGAGSVVTIIGSKVREVLRGREDLRDILDTWRLFRSRGGDGSAREHGLTAVSTVLSDENMQEISFTADRFDITYRSRGYLLAVIPWSFPVRVTVIPQAPEGSRVTIKLPWYRFFVREFFTPQKLAADLEAAMQTAAASDADAVGENQQILLFETVARELRAKVGTVSDSILLGTQ